MPARRTIVALLVAAVAATLLAACDGGSAAPRPTPTALALPSPVTVRSEPDAVTLTDPAFDPLPGAKADFGRLGGAVYQIEMPDDWNGSLVLYIHGYQDLAPQTNVSAPDFRHYLITHGYAWGASSFSSTSLIPGRAADETAALWDAFAQKYGRPAHTYVTGASMGGAATQIAAERYPDRFDGALAMCGNAGNAEGAAGQADFVAAAAYVAGVTQADWDAAPDVTALIRDRIMPALEGPAAATRFEDIMLDLTGGPRALAAEGFRLEEATNWRRALLLVAAGIAPNTETHYRLGPLSSVSDDEYNRAVIRFHVNDAVLNAFTSGNETTGDIKIPVLSLHTTGDGEVPIEQARVFQRRVDAAERDYLLVQRVFADPGHCGFTTAEQEASFEALVAWVTDGRKPEGDDVLVDDLRTLGTRFTLRPSESSPNSTTRVTFSGNLTLDGAPLNADFLGAVVRRDGLITPCQLNLPPVSAGRYEITVLGDAEGAGCGAPGAEVMFWTFADDKFLFTQAWTPWPDDGTRASVDASFSTANPDGARPPVTEFSGEIYTRAGDHPPTGTRVEALIGDVICGVASTRGAGSFDGYIMDVIGPQSRAGCDPGATIILRVNGTPAAEAATNTLQPADHGDSFDLTLP